MTEDFDYQQATAELLEIRDNWRKESEELSDRLRDTNKPSPALELERIARKVQTGNPKVEGILAQFEVSKSFD